MGAGRRGVADEREESGRQNSAGRKLTLYGERWGDGIQLVGWEKVPPVHPLPSYLEYYLFKKTLFLYTKFYLRKQTVTCM